MIHDILIAGGGLSGSLLAWWLKRHTPSLRILLLEQSDRLGGNHTWAFFETDLEVSLLKEIEPLVAKSWSTYEVRFPRVQRVLPTGYRAISSRQLHALISTDLAGDVRFNARVAQLTSNSAVMADHKVINAKCVIDARSATSSPHLVLGFQKFLGCEVQLPTAHGQTRPIIMDACVAQLDGYRFFYTLPFSSDRLLIYDTYYSDDATQTPDDLRRRILAYAASQGWDNGRIIREEEGVLPIIMAGDFEGHLKEEMNGPPRIGLAGAYFQPTTGYSLPDAVRMAAFVTRLALSGDLTTDRLREALHRCARALWRERSYFRLLNRMMFRAGVPQKRYSIIERFYKMNAGLIQRFYAAQLKPADKLRLVTGKPPVPILKALACLSEKQMLKELS